MSLGRPIVRIGLSLSGYVYGESIATAEEADRRGFYVDETKTFEPFFEGDRVALSLEPEVLGFLSRIRAAFTTHIAALLDRAQD